MENKKKPSLKRRRKAIKDFKKGYKNFGKVRSGEYSTEKGEFYWDGDNVSLLPTDDADRPITDNIKKKNLGKNWK